MPETRLANSAFEPILPGFHPDPTICRVGDDYYLSTSSFEYFPGAPIFHSKDLLTWSPIGHIMTRRSQFRLGNGRASTGIYGSTLRHHEGTFWFITTNVSDFNAGQVLVHATDPAGPWSEPVFVSGALGIDPDLCWDEDGRCYLTWKAMSFSEGEVGILQAPLDLASGQLLDQPYPIWQGSGLGAVEAPHLYSVGGLWYLLLAEGGTERGHCVTAARAPHPSGPFESCPSNPVFTHRSLIHPVQNVGHADLVQGPDGEWAAVYLGVRPRGSTPGFHVLGRETFIAGLEWENGWPVFNENKYHVPPVRTSFSDDFSDETPHERWVVPGGEAGSVAVIGPEGGVKLRSLPDGSPGLLCARVRDLSWSAEAAVLDEGTFMLRIDERYSYGLTYDTRQVLAWARVGDIHHQFSVHSVDAGPVVLRIRSEPPSSPAIPLGNGGPDEIVLSVVGLTGEIELARLDGRHLSTEVASGFTGRMLGIKSATGKGRILNVKYSPTEPDIRKFR